MLNLIDIYKFGRIQTSQTGGQPYSDTSHYEVSECSLDTVIMHLGVKIREFCYCRSKVL